MESLEKMIDDIKSRVEDPARREMLIQMSMDLIEASVLQASDPEMADALLRHLKAQSLTLAATETKVLSDAFMDWARDAARALLVAALSA